MTQSHPHDARQVEDLFVWTRIITTGVATAVTTSTTTATVSGEGIIPVILEYVPRVHNAIIAARDEDPAVGIILDVLDPVCMGSQVP